ncbi:hypothetical protein D9M68_680010 [compost metagenome]
MILARLHLAHAVPERARHVVVATGQQGDVIHQLVGVVVLRVDPAGPRLQAHVDVLGHQHHGHARLAALQLHQLVDDLVVVEVFRQPGDGGCALAHEDREKTAGAALLSLDGYAVLHFLGGGAAEDLVDVTDGLPAFGSDALLAGLELVQFLQHGHRNGHVVFLEVEQGVGIVNQDVGVERVQGWSGRAGASMVIHTRSPSYRARRRNARQALRRGGPPTSPLRVMPGRGWSQQGEGLWPPPVCRIRRSVFFLLQSG